ncbi:MAG: ABC transporter C-terminal domain-containing protein, partial [Flavisolibacter sp.]
AVVAEPVIKTVEPGVEKPSTEKRKLSFKEQKELETLDAELPKLELRKADIEKLLASGISDVKEIEKLSNEFTTISSQIDEKTMRWMELQD